MLVIVAISMYAGPLSIDRSAPDIWLYNFYMYHVDWASMEDVPCSTCTCNITRLPYVVNGRKPSLSSFNPTLGIIR